MRFLIACDKFKGSLTASQAGAAIERGLAQAGQKKVRILPIADGGEGLTRILSEACGGMEVLTTARDPLGRVVPARYGRLPEGTAVIEMAEASGLWRLSEDERDPWRASTAGTGDLIRHAVEVGGARKILLGLGGSATNDGGTGMAAALGVAFFRSDNTATQSVPEELPFVTLVDMSGRLALPPVEVACDVSSPLLGPLGATRMFGPQKGVSPAQLEIQEARLEHLAALLGPRGADLASRPGAGAAGGLGFGSLVFLGATLRSGFDLVAEATGLAQAIQETDMVITGEGRLDAQTLQGKGPAGVADMAHQHGKRVVAFAGAIADEARNSLGRIFEEVIAISPPQSAMTECVARAEEWLEAAAARWAAGLT